MSTPIAVGGLYESDSPVTNQKEFQEIVGCLLFLSTRTRPDVCK